MTVNNIVSEDDLPNNSKEVRFHKIVKTILVPEKSEYNSIKQTIWWDKEQIDQMKLYMMADLKSFVMCSRITPSESFEENLEKKEISVLNKDILRERETLKIAMKKLYQPNEGKFLNSNNNLKTIEITA